MYRTAICLISVLLFWIETRAAGTEMESAERQLEVIAASAKLYLESSSGYVAGDLITESQVEELQHYLLISHGKSPATHSGLLNRAIKDRAPLSRFFYSENGAETLRAAASKLGGYAEIEALAHHREGREALQKAVFNQSVADIVDLVEISRHATSKQDNHEKNSDRHQLKTIYTLDEFLEAAFSNGRTEAQQSELLQP